MWPRSHRKWLSQALIRSPDSCDCVFNHREVLLPSRIGKKEGCTHLKAWIPANSSFSIIPAPRNSPTLFCHEHFSVYKPQKLRRYFGSLLIHPHKFLNLEANLSWEKNDISSLEREHGFLNHDFQWVLAVQSLGEMLISHGLHGAVRLVWLFKK